VSTQLVTRLQTNKLGYSVGMEKMIFAKIFQQLTGNPPFPWQEALYDRFVFDRIDNIPSSCNLPSILCPLFRGGMEFMRLKCKSQPEVDVRNVHSNYTSPTRSLLRQRSQQFARWLGKHFLEPKTGRVEARSSEDFWRRESQSPSAVSPSRPCPQEEWWGRRVQSRRSVQCLEFACCYSGRVSSENQAKIPSWLGKRLE